MPIDSLDHYTINVSDLDASVRFYGEVLGLEAGERPPFDFPGAWLYLGRHPVVHLVAGARETGPGTGAIDHVAFRANGVGELTRRLAERGIPFRERDVPDSALHQVFLEDPDGVTIEVNFWDEGGSQG